VLTNCAALAGDRKGKSRELGHTGFDIAKGGMEYAFTQLLIALRS
jgi:hypothetical protein